MLKTRGDSLEGKLCLVSGSGNVAQYTIEKLIDLGAKPVTLSDRTATSTTTSGIDREKLALGDGLKNVRAAASSEYAKSTRGRLSTRRTTTIRCGATATAPSRARRRTRSMATTPSNLLKQRRLRRQRGGEHAVHARGGQPVRRRRILYGPGKAANAGGVATSGLEMAQNSMRYSWMREEVDRGCTAS
jgi:glutamate dehydrogenase (NADP+)